MRKVHVVQLKNVTGWTPFCRPQLPTTLRSKILPDLRILPPPHPWAKDRFLPTPPTPWTNRWVSLLALRLTMEFWLSSHTVCTCIRLGEVTGLWRCVRWSRNSEPQEEAKCQVCKFNNLCTYCKLPLTNPRLIYQGRGFWTAYYRRGLYPRGHITGIEKALQTNYSWFATTWQGGHVGGQ